MPDIDPATSTRRAMEQLTNALLRVDEHLLALNAPTLGMSLQRAKTTNEMGRLPQSALTEQFISKAWVPEKTTKAEEGDYSSIPPKIQPIYDEGLPGSQGRRRQLANASLPPGVDLGEGRSPIRGLDPMQAQQMEEEPIRIPQFGDWQIDAYLKLASQMAGKRAIKQAQKRSEAGEPPLLPEEQSPLSAGNISGHLAEAAQYAAPFQIGKQHIERIASHVYAAQEMGASLGYSPQTGVGGQYILGIRNPLAALTSEAGRQGIGQKFGAIGAVLGGGISYEQASGLREALSSEGFSNQNAGFLGMTTGGENENLALALEEPVKEGLRPRVAAGFANTTRFGVANVNELSEALKGMGDTAKTLKQTLDQTGESMQSFAKETAEAGSTQIHGLQAYKEIAGATGVSPSITTQILHSPIGQATTIGQGLLPGQVAGASGYGQAMMAQKAVQYAETLAGPVANYHASYATVEGERIQTESAEAKRYGFMSEISGIPAEQLKRMHDEAAKIKAATGTEARAKHLHDKAQEAWEKHNTEFMRNNPNISREHDQLSKELEEGWKRYHAEEKTGTWSNQAQSEMSVDLRKKQEALDRVTKLGTTAGRITKPEHIEQGRQWASLLKPAEEAGISTEKFKEIGDRHHNYAARFADLEREIQNQQTVKEEEAEGKTFIDLSPDAKKWFRLHGPKGNEEANAGGKPKASNAANPYRGESAQFAAFRRQMEQSATVYRGG